MIVDLALHGTIDKHLSSLLEQVTNTQLQELFGEGLEELEASRFDYAVLAQCRTTAITAVGNLLRQL